MDAWLRGAVTADPPGRGCVECRQYALKACARGPALMYGSLIPYITGGHTFRIAPIQAMQTRHALDSGMTRGEVAAARSNFEALVRPGG